MPEKSTHRRAKKKAAGYGGKTEVSLPGNKRLDAITKNRRRATEVERSGLPNRLDAAAQRLKKSRASKKVLQVPQYDMGNAVKSMRKEGIGGTVKSMDGTRYWRVPPPKK